MNFLAHAYLAAPDDALIAGGVIGDWIKGPLSGQLLPPDLLRGVALHRAIDAFADREPAFLRSRARISAPRRRWSGVLIDMFYDHLLALNWENWSDLPLGTFTAGVYSALERNQHHMPESVAQVMRLMADEDWLGSYRANEGLDAILQRMGRRARQPNPLGDGIEELQHAGAGIAADFNEFLPAARAFALDWINRAPPILASA